MDSLGAQFARIFVKRFNKIVPDAAVPLTEQVFERTTEFTRSGKAPFGGRYDEPYRPKYAKVRRKAGKQIEAVDLRFRTQNIQQKRRQDTKRAAVIGFANGGRIFKYHHEGVRYRNGDVRQRKLFPTHWRDLPKDMYQEFRKRVVRIMNGK